MCMCVHVCVSSACVYVCICIYVCLCRCMHIHLYTRACGYFSIFAGVRLVCGCVLVYARTHTLTTWVLDVSPGVGRTPGEPEESRWTEAQYICRPYRCTKYICLYICWAVGFDDLG